MEAAALPQPILICSLFEDQRPLKGAAGLLDWKLRGLLSKFVLKGRIHGRREEVTYVPFLYRGTQRHLLLVGLGPVRESDARSARGALKTAGETARRLGFENAMVSLSGFSPLGGEEVREALEPLRSELTE